MKFLIADLQSSTIWALAKPKSRFFRFFGFIAAAVSANVLFAQEIDFEHEEFDCCYIQKSQELSGSFAQQVTTQNSNKIVIGAYPSEGLFSSFLTVLGALMYAEKNQKTPVIYWPADWCCAQKGGYNDSLNPWEYYFEPVSNLQYVKGDYISFYDQTFVRHIFALNNGTFDKELRQTSKKIIDKYIKVKPSILKKVDSFYNDSMKGITTIGIHLRGTDLSSGMPKYLAMLNGAEELAKSFTGDVQFLVATDDESLLDLAKKNLTRPIIYCDSHRSAKGLPLHLPRGGIEWRAIIGEEALIDALLLAKCDFLVHTLSSLPAAVLTFNPTLPHKFF